MYLIINKWVIAVKVSNFSGHYLRNHRTLGIGVLGYIGIVWPKEHSPEVRSFPPGTPCIFPLPYEYLENLTKVSFIGQLQQDKKRLCEESERATLETRELRQEVELLRGRLEETEWGLCQKTGELSLLKAQLKDSQVRGSPFWRLHIRGSGVLVWKSPIAILWHCARDRFQSLYVWLLSRSHGGDGGLIG